MDGLSIFALIIIIFVVLTLAYGMIAIHDIPYHIAKKRNHPHQDAIHAGGWISLFTLHAIWPFLWIWATCYHPQYGYRGGPPPGAEKDERSSGGKVAAPVSPEVADLESRLAKLEAASRTAEHS